MYKFLIILSTLLKITGFLIMVASTGYSNELMLRVAIIGYCVMSLPALYSLTSGLYYAIFGFNHLPETFDFRKNE